MGQMFSGTRTAIGVESTTVFTATADCVVAGCLVTNSGSGEMPVTVNLVSANDTVHLLRRMRIGAGDSADATNGVRVALASGERLVATCPVADTASAIVTLYKDE